MIVLQAGLDLDLTVVFILRLSSFMGSDSFLRQSSIIVNFDSTEGYQAKNEVEFHQKSIGAIRVHPCGFYENYRTVENPQGSLSIIQRRYLFGAAQHTQSRLLRHHAA